MPKSSHTPIKKGNSAPQHRQRGASIYSVCSWSPPKLHEGKCWYVDFVCWDPAKKSMRRKKYHVDNMPTPRARRKRANEIILNLMRRLQEGWNPWVDSSSLRCYSLYSVITVSYSRYVEKMYGAGQIKRWTYLDWKSYHKGFDAWLAKYPARFVYVYQLDRRIVTEFLDYLLLDREVSAQTRNNYRAWLFQYCEWLIGRGYLEENPVKGTKKLRVPDKRRDSLTALEMAKLKDYLSTRNRHFLLACMIEYYCFVRPIELVQVRLQYFNIRKQQLFIPGTIAKNKRDYMVGLNPTVIQLMVELRVFDSPGNFFLFGKDFCPSAVQADSRIFRDYFVSVRRALKWPASKKFYSLKDSGIRDLANAEGIVVARDQARHQDIETTNRYLKADALTAHEATKHFKGAF